MLTGALMEAMVEYVANAAGYTASGDVCAAATRAHYERPSIGVDADDASSSGPCEALSRLPGVESAGQGTVMDVSAAGQAARSNLEHRASTWCQQEEGYIAAPSSLNEKMESLCWSRMDFPAMWALHHSCRRRVLTCAHVSMEK